MMHLCLVYSEENKLDAVPDGECLAYDAALRKSGYCLASWRSSRPYPVFNIVET